MFLTDVFLRFGTFAYPAARTRLKRKFGDAGFGGIFLNPFKRLSGNRCPIIRLTRVMGIFYV